jgi:hypothetical protein
VKINKGLRFHPPSQDAEVISEGRMVVDIIRDEGIDLENNEESIGIISNGTTIIELTWAEARDLSRALRLVEGVARNG